MNQSKGINLNVSIFKHRILGVAVGLHHNAKHRYSGCTRRGTAASAALLTLHNRPHSSNHRGLAGAGMSCNSQSAVLPRLEWASQSGRALRFALTGPIPFHAGRNLAALGRTHRFSPVEGDLG